MAKKKFKLAPSGRKYLSHEEEFSIMKLVLDKFLWLGFIVMVLGLYKVAEIDVQSGVSMIVVGAIILMLFIVILIREYEIEG